MGKTIRKGVFETNSSSTHSVCIKPEEWEKWGTNHDRDSPFMSIVCKENLAKEKKAGLNPITATIKTSNYYKRGGGYFLIEGVAKKIQFIASCMSTNLKTVNCSLQGDQLELFQAMYRAIDDYLKKEYNIQYIEIECEKLYGDGSFMESLIGRHWEKEREFTKEEIYEIVTKVILDDSIVFTCYSDESGPFPEDVGLKEIENLRNLLKTDNDN